MSYLARGDIYPAGFHQEHLIFWDVAALMFWYDEACDLASTHPPKLAMFPPLVASWESGALKEEVVHMASD